jgi:hypothetical protein
MPTPVRLSPRPSAPGTLWVVVLCSFVAGAATSLAVVRLTVGFASSKGNATVSTAVTPAPAPAPESFPPPAITRNDPPSQIHDTPAPVDVSPAPVVDTPPSPPPPDLPKMLAQPMAVAAASVQLANAVLQEPLFVSGHTGLINDLGLLKAAAEAMKSDNGSDPAKTERHNEALAQALDIAIKRADTIATRKSEPDTGRQATAALRDALRLLRGQ